MIGTGVHIYNICLWTKKYLNRTLVIDSLFQTFAVGLLVKFITTARSRNAFLVE